MSSYVPLNSTLLSLLFVLYYEYIQHIMPMNIHFFRQPGCANLPLSSSVSQFMVSFSYPTDPWLSLHSLHSSLALLLSQYICFLLHLFALLHIFQKVFDFNSSAWNGKKFSVVLNSIPWQVYSRKTFWLARI